MAAGAGWWCLPLQCCCVVVASVIVVRKPCGEAWLALFDEACAKVRPRRVCRDIRTCCAALRANVDKQADRLQGEDWLLFLDGDSAMTSARGRVACYWKAATGEK